VVSFQGRISSGMKCVARKKIAQPDASLQNSGFALRCKHPIDNLKTSNINWLCQKAGCQLAESSRNLRSQYIASRAAPATSSVRSATGSRGDLIRSRWPQVQQVQFQDVLRAGDRIGNDPAGVPGTTRRPYETHARARWWSFPTTRADRARTHSPDGLRARALVLFNAAGASPSAPSARSDATRRPSGIPA
jgi:hypothetical protein